jgi:hypothetical protein
MVDIGVTGLAVKKISANLLAERSLSECMHASGANHSRVFLLMEENVV